MKVNNVRLHERVKPSLSFEKSDIFTCISWIIISYGKNLSFLADENQRLY